MGVLYVMLTQEYSGAETAYEPVLRADADPLVACPPCSATQAWLAGLGVPTVPLGFREIRSSAGAGETLKGVGRALAVARDLRRLLHTHPDRDVVLGTTMRSSMLASLAAPRRAVWTVTDLVNPRPLAVVLRSLARVTGARVITHSRFIAERTAPPGALVSPPGIALDDEAPAEREPALALVVGHVSPTKRTDLALEVAALVAAEKPNFRIDVIGRAQYRPEDFALERELETRLGSDAELARHVRLCGHEPAVRERMRRATVLLHLRPDEPFGMVLLEAMAVGLPVVAPAAAGPLEIVVDGETGLLYRPEDARAAADAVLRLIRDPELAARLGAAGRNRVRERFTVERQVREVLAFATRS